MEIFHFAMQVCVFIRKSVELKAYWETNATHRLMPMGFITLALNRNETAETATNDIWHNYKYNECIEKYLKCFLTFALHFAVRSVDACTM